MRPVAHSVSGMEESEFDRFADEYHAQLAAGLAFSGEGPEYFSEYKIADVRRELALRGERREDLQVLDFGAGIGASVPWTRRYFPRARLTCLDPSRRSLDVAEQRFGDVARYVHFDGHHIPFGDGAFDVAFAMCVFHHIDADEHVPLMRELRRVLRPGGMLFIFEHNPFNPLTVRIVNNCPFDENAVLIRGSALRRELQQAGFASPDIRYRIFFPGFLRALRPLERALAWLPVGGQYYALATK